jgi:ParB family chromosome partitioning protein
MEMVETGELSAGHARALIPLSEPKRQLEAAQEVLRKGLSVRKTELLAAKAIRDAQKESEESAEDELKVDYAAELSDELSRALGRKVHLSEGRRGGRIELSYYSPEDREVLIDALRALAKLKY